MPTAGSPSSTGCTYAATPSTGSRRLAADRRLCVDLDSADRLHARLAVKRWPALASMAPTGCAPASPQTAGLAAADRLRTGLATAQRLASGLDMDGSPPTGCAPASIAPTGWVSSTGSASVSLPRTWAPAPGSLIPGGRSALFLPYFNSAQSGRK
jgi:hypothetical protein